MHLRSRRPFGAAMLIATWFGCGLVPVAPGTAGSAAALAIAIALHAYFGAGRGVFAVLAIAILLPAVWAAGEAARQLNLKDPRSVVVDEVAGQWVTLLGATAFNWKSWLGCFLLFRLFDVWKPFPIRRLERLPGGVGIVADDILAGLYGALVIFVVGLLRFY
jgi:phosphatidylglycerophosphatase A